MGKSRGKCCFPPNRETFHKGVEWGGGTRTSKCAPGITRCIFNYDSNFHRKSFSKEKEGTTSSLPPTLITPLVGKADLFKFENQLTMLDGGSEYDMYVWSKMGDLISVKQWFYMCREHEIYFLKVPVFIQTFATCSKQP